MSRNIAIAGVTGVVGQEFLRLIEERNFKFDSLKVLASSRSAGKKIQFMGEEYTVEELTEDSFKGVDVALFSAGGSQSKKFADAVVQSGAVMIDNSSAFRMDPNAPLVVPEVNPEAIRENKGIIANPNCSTIIALVPVWPLHRQNKVKRMVISTYQAASGAGIAAMNELKKQSGDILEGKEPVCEALPYQAAFNVFCHDSKIGESGYNEEEMKMVNETRKIFDDSQIGITCTCVRVPVMRAHSESINLEFEKPADPAWVREVLKNAPGVTVIDDREKNRFPMPAIDADGKDDIYVGRIRRDESISGGRGINLWVCGDQIRKGAALNAVQIAEAMDF
ncbi:aspartate-semialdehyde dehydrogenase [Sedimentisphaera salicampi]|uniref:Aspartate-semialdehyde dehydrogenase n=1 Tax=Sedimentisphaera salicampi TaxID=1941349 RepID=A0A1W6LLZ1_9BACT|nr:aspartate-semialdehyde dehydrogenase [Sedimentisphaera salicampi]ARN56772.1 Aspartate-semialdehyde dehydrogenase [Sedimentisphaera salicampi]